MTTDHHLSIDTLLEYVINKYPDKEILITSYSRKIPLTVFLCTHVKTDLAETLSYALNTIFYENDLDFKIVDIDEWGCVEKPSSKFKIYEGYETFKADYQDLVNKIITKFEMNDLYKYIDVPGDADIGYFVDNVRVDVVAILDNKLSVDITAYGEQEDYIHYLSSVMSKLMERGGVYFCLVEPIGYQVEVLRECDENEQKEYIDIVLTLKYHEEQENA